MYLGAPDRSVRYEIGRLLSRAPNRVMRDPEPPSMHLAHPLVYGNHRISIGDRDRGWISNERNSKNGWRRLYICSQVRHNRRSILTVTEVLGEHEGKMFAENGVPQVLGLKVRTDVSAGEIIWRAKVRDQRFFLRDKSFASLETCDLVTWFADDRLDFRKAGDDVKKRKMNLIFGSHVKTSDHRPRQKDDGR